MELPVDFESLIGIIDLFAHILINTTYHYGLVLAGGRITLRYQFPSINIKASNLISDSVFPNEFFFGLAMYPRHTAALFDTSEKCRTGRKLIPNGVMDYNNNRANTELYQKYEEYIKFAERANAKMIKFSLSYSNILPYGFGKVIDEDILEQYDIIIEKMLENEMTPMVTLFHWDVPYPIQELGGWTNPMIIEWFTTYAEIVFATLGDKVKYWLTIDDPVSFCTRGYDGDVARQMNVSGIGVYLCGHNVLLAHARIHRLYHQRFRSVQKGKVGIGQNFMWFEPENGTLEKDVAAVEMAFQWYNGWIMNPLFGKDADYPKYMRSRIDFKSFFHEFAGSRLPGFTVKQSGELRDAADFLGIDFHATARVRGLKIDAKRETDFNRDADITIVSEDNSGVEGFTKLMRRLNKHYALPELFVIRNEYSGMKVANKIRYYKQNNWEIMKLMQEGLDIRGHFTRIIPPT